MEYLKELVSRADLGSWASWSTQDRVLVGLAGLLAAYLVIRVMVPALLRLLFPAFFIVLGLAVLWALFPRETCSIELLSSVPVLCR